MPRRRRDPFEPREEGYEAAQLDLLDELRCGDWDDHPERGRLARVHGGARRRGSALGHEPGPSSPPDPAAEIFD